MLLYIGKRIFETSLSIWAVVVAQLVEQSLLF